MSKPSPDRVEGVLLGAACGDALGVPYEFGTRMLKAGDEPAMLGGGLGPYAPGEWSDDTQMSVVVASVAAEQDLRDESALDAVVEGWIGWLQGGATDVGTQTRQVLTAAVGERGRPGAAARARNAAAELHRRTGRTAGNGSLMRTAPVALAFLADPDGLTEAARAVSDLTHPDPVAGDACVVWCHAVRRAVLDACVVDLADLLSSLPAGRRDQWAEWIAAAEDQPPSAFTPNGYAPRALQAAWSAIRHPAARGSHGDGQIAASLTAAVRAGDDTDTVAAIAGALLGARWGASGLPADWLNAVHGWPGLDATGLSELARRVVVCGGGRAPAAGPTATCGATKEPPPEG